MHKVRVSEIAKELGIKSKEVIEKSKNLNIELKAANSTVTDDTAQGIVQYIMSGKIPEGFKKVETPKEVKSVKDDISSEDVKKSKEIKKENREKEQPKEEKREKKSKVAQKEEPKKEQSKDEKAPKKEEEKKDESLAQSSIMRRRVGRIKIIKKKKPEVIKKKEPEVKKVSSFEKSNLPSSSASNNENSMEKLFKKTSSKKKKKKEAQAPKAKVEKIDFERDLRDSNARTIDEPEEEVVLMDLSVEDEVKKEQEKKVDSDKVKITRKSSFLNQRGIKRSKRKKAPKKMPKLEDVTSITIPENCRVYEFAEKINKTISEVISVLFKLGMLVNKNDFLEADYIEILAEEFSVEVKTIDPLEEMNYVSSYDEIEDDFEAERPPVITIMGHVDHGKTSLLDKIRDSKVTHGEAGGITQHIGAYIIEKNGKKITFLDTPGHEAFTEMRARGASVTDIVIIVVAADDGVKPQTLEAISHAKAAEVPIIVAINKIDKEAANVDLVKSQMAEHGITATDWGGEYEFMPVSAHSGEGIDDLLDTILLQSEIMELTANPKKKAKAIVVEATLEKGRGASATIVVQNGTLNVGDNFIVDTTYGKIRDINNDLGSKVKALTPGEPGVVIGFNEVPQAGTILIATDNEREARENAQRRAEFFRQKQLSKTTKVSFDELGDLIAEGKIKALPVIIKADVQGSLEAIKGSLEKLKNEEVKISVIHSGVGAISESDVTLGSASENSVILGFNVRPTASVKAKAKESGVEIKTYSIIYDLLDDVKAFLGGMMSPVVKEEVTGQAEVRDTFTISKIGTIAGTIVTDGTMVRGSKARLIRDGVVVYSSSIDSLKRFKDDAKEVAKGYECGIMLENYNDLKVGDIIETFKEVEEQANL